MQEATLCIQNIGPLEQRRRLIMGSAIWVATGLALAFQLQAQLGWEARVLLAPLWMYGAVCLLQVPAKTCVFLAAKGERVMDAPTEKIVDEALDKALRAKARMVWVQSAVTAAALTGLSCLL